MPFIDAAIPGVIGLAILAWPQFVFIGSRVTPDQKKLRHMRWLGTALVLLALGLLTIQLASG